MNGILLINKEKEMTSFDVIAKLRKILHTKQIGHTGTLDPNATGLLIVMVGKACKILPYIKNNKKEYIATLKFGYKTDTGDIWGKTIEEKEVSSFDTQQIEAVFKSFIGKQMQVPPMVSAVKINGKKLYEYAREGIEIERPAKEIEIYELELIEMGEEIKFRAVCSSGTFIRVLCEEIAEKLNNIGTMSRLVRTKIDHFEVENALKLDEISDDIKLFTPYEMLIDYPYIEYENVDDIYNGKRIFLDTEHDLVMIVSKNEVLAAYKRENGKKFKSMRGFW